MTQSSLPAAKSSCLPCAVQENPNEIPEGETPHNVTMLCYDEMVDSAKPGDRVTITGIYKATALRVNPRLKALKVRPHSRLPLRGSAVVRQAPHANP